MKTTIVCGMLGSGKTTFIKNLLAAGAEKTVVLVNDFGRAGIDGEIFSAGGIEAIELPSGCVCCTLKFDLITTIQRVRERFTPAHLVIEPSGVASPSGVLDALATLKIESTVVVSMIDTVEFADLHASEMYGNFFIEQVKNADVVLINKIDLAGGDATDRAAAIVEMLNPGAVTYRTSHARLTSPLPEISPGRGAPVRSNFHVQFDTLSLAVPDGISREKIEAFFHQLGEGEYGRIVRAKALVNTGAGPYRFDLSSGDVRAETFGRPVEGGRIVIIGEGLDRDGIAAALR